MPDQAVIPAVTSVHALKDSWFVFQVAGSQVALRNGAFTGRERVYVDGRCVSTQYAWVSSEHKFEISGVAYSLSTTTIFGSGGAAKFLSRMWCTVSGPDGLTQSQEMVVYHAFPISRFLMYGLIPLVAFALLIVEVVNPWQAVAAWLFGSFAAWALSVIGLRVELHSPATGPAPTLKPDGLDVTQTTGRRGHWSDWAVVGVAALLCTGLWGSQHFGDKCNSQVQARELREALESCRIARPLNMPFQWARGDFNARVLANLGLAETMAGRLPAANEHLMAAFSHHESRAKRDSRDYALTLVNLGTLAGIEGRPNDQLQFSKDAIDMMHRLHISCEAIPFDARVGQVAALRTLGRKAEALDLAADHVSQQRGCERLPRRVRAAAYRMLGLTELDSAENEDALESFGSAERIMRRGSSPVSLELAHALGDRALALRELNQLGEALASINAALEIVKMEPGPDSITMSEKLVVRASIDRFMEQPKRAIGDFLEANRILKLHFGEGHPRRASVLVQLAGAYAEAGLSKDARNSLSEAQGIYANAFGKASPKVSEVQQAIRNLDSSAASAEQRVSAPKVSGK